jgi:hypothetical protein
MKIPNTIQEVNMWKFNTTSLEKKYLTNKSDSITFLHQIWPLIFSLNLYHETNIFNAENLGTCLIPKEELACQHQALMTFHGEWYSTSLCGRFSYKCIHCICVSLSQPTCRAPKFLVDPLEGPSMRQCGRSWNLEHDPDFQH